MSVDTVTLDRADYDRLRQCTGLADVLLDQLEAVLRLVKASRTDRDALHAAELVATHAREVLRPGAAHAAARRLADLGGTQPGIEGAPRRRFGALAGHISVSADFDAPLEIDEATVARAARDNPDLPRPFVASTLQALAESRAPETSWNYRVMEFTEGEERWHAIHEVHYRKGVPASYTAQPASVQWDPEDSNDTGHRILDRMREATSKPVLRPADFA